MPPRDPSAAELDAWAERLYDEANVSVARRANEPGLISDLDPVIRQALTALYGFGTEAFDVERNTLPRGAGYSPVDRVYGSVLVEYEWQMGAARRRHGAEQALTYLGNIEATTGAAEEYIAVVTDGREWGFLVERRETQPSLFSPERQPDEFFEWRAISPPACRRFLQLCGTYDRTPVSGQALAVAFGPTSEAVTRFIALLATVLEGRSPDDRTDTLWREWTRSTEIVYGVLDEFDAELAGQLRATYGIPIALCDQFSELLFVVHSFFALVARLVAVETLAIGWNDVEARPSHWYAHSDADLTSLIERLDTGEIPAGLETIDNLFESDVFSWWVDHLDTELLAAVRELLGVLARFAFPTLAFGAAPPTDLLRELYLRLVPRELRRRLGEFPTPAWLAEACLERLAQQGAPLTSGRVLDPTCGTGTFLIPLLRRRLSQLRAEKGDTVTSTDVQAALDGVVGLDVNPIAVTATRSNMLVALGSLAGVGNLRLPVWRTDSIVLPDVSPSQGSMVDPRLAGRAYFELRTSAPEPFPVPTLLHNATGIGTLRRAIEAGINERDRAAGRNRYLAELDGAVGPSGTRPVTTDPIEWADALSVLEVLYERIRVLAESGRNGVWARILENSFAPLFIGRYDAVVGNPPWLSWHRLPDRWRSAAESLWRRFGLWEIPYSFGERRRSRGQFNDIATLVFATALSRYAKTSGWVGFLTPDALIIADPGARAFRKFWLRTDVTGAHDNPVDLRFAIRHYDYWGGVKPFGAEAANRPAFLVAQRDHEHGFPVPTSRWERTQPGAVLAGTWSVVRAQLTEVQGASVPADPGVPYSAWSFIGTGVDLLTGGQNSWAFGMGVNTRGAAGVFHVAVDRPNPAAGTVRIRNLPSDGRNREVVEHRANVEAALVHPFFRGRDIEAWRVTPSGYMFITQDPNSFTDLLDETTFQAHYPHALRWLRRHRTVLERRSVPNSSWDIGGRDWYRLEGPFAHLTGPHLVVLPEQELPPPAAVVSVGAVDHALGRRALPLPNHKVVFCAVPTMEEAGYLVAVLNSTVIQRFLESYGSSTAISPTTLSRLSIPPFEPTDLQNEIAGIARSIIKSANPTLEAGSMRVTLDGLVEMLLDAPAPAATRPRRARKRAAPRTSTTESLF